MFSLKKRNKTKDIESEEILKKKTNGDISKGNN